MKLPTPHLTNPHGFRKISFIIIALLMVVVSSITVWQVQEVRRASLRTQQAQEQEKATKAQVSKQIKKELEAAKVGIPEDKKDTTTAEEAPTGTPPIAGSVQPSAPAPKPTPAAPSPPASPTTPTPSPTSPATWNIVHPTQADCSRFASIDKIWASTNAKHDAVDYQGKPYSYYGTPAYKEDLTQFPGWATGYKTPFYNTPQWGNKIECHSVAGWIKLQNQTSPIFYKFEDISLSAPPAQSTSY